MFVLRLEKYERVWSILDDEGKLQTRYLDSDPIQAVARQRMEKTMDEEAVQAREESTRVYLLFNRDLAAASAKYSSDD